MFKPTQKRIGFILLIFSFSLTSVLIDKKVTSQVAAANGLVEIIYQPTNRDFANPERGFMKQSSIWVDQPLGPDKIRALLPSDSIVWIYFRLDNYRDPRDGYGVTLNDYQGRRIDQDGLSTIRSAFQTARNKGLKLVIRFVYNPGPGSTSDPNKANPDAPLDFVLQHIAQLKPILVENNDVIVAMQVGFVGHWGEWHSSKYLFLPEHKKTIVDALLDALPENRMLMLRYPRYKELFYQGPITAQEAFSQTDGSRIGHHNDCFLRGEDDAGTYASETRQAPPHLSHYCDGKDEVGCWKGFIAQEGQFTPIGGETCQYHPPRTDCPNALSEMQNLHWSFINNGYHPEVLDGWVSGGCMGEIRQRLGYRFVLSRLALSKQVRPGGTVEFHLELENKGFASLFNERPAIIVLEEKTTGYRKKIPLTNVDPRKWLPGQIIHLDAQIPIPTDLSEGTYSLSLWLPDAHQRLRQKPQYAIRLANQNVWQSETGFNLLFDNLLVSRTPISSNRKASEISTAKQ